MGLTKRQRAMTAARVSARAASQARAEAAEQARLADPQRRATIETAAMIAWILGETEYAPRLQLLRCVQALGCDLARDLLEEALRIDGDGGELVASGTRCRTVGGIFFRLARKLIRPEEWAQLVAQGAEPCRH